MIEIKDTPTFGRDIDSKAVINNNKAALVEIKSKRELNKRLNDMESDIRSIKSLLEQLLIQQQK